MFPGPIVSMSLFGALIYVLLNSYFPKN
jgi:hypothetical protein